MKKLFTILGLVIPFFGLSQTNETTVYSNNFNTDNWNSTLSTIGGSLVNWTSGSLDQSYDGSPVFESTSNFTQTWNIDAHTLSEVTVSMRVKKAYGQDAQFLLEYITLQGSQWVTLFEGFLPSGYYSNIVSSPIDLGNCDGIIVRFKTFGGTGWHYVDDITVSGPTPECGEGCVFDSNDDGNINFVDMLDFLSIYGSTCY